MPPEHPSGLRVVCFDLGGVLVRICRSWQEACDRAGVDATRIDAERFSLVRPREHTARLQRGEITIDEYARATSDALGGAYSPEEIRRVHAAWTMECYDGVDRIVHGLNAQGLATACLSNTDHAHWDVLALHDAINALSMRTASHLIGELKPDAAAFHAFETLADATGPSIAYFDDLQENVEAALRCGWNAWPIDPLNETAPQIRAGLASFGIDV